MTQTRDQISCWVISEGHAGMENQAIGLAEALGLSFKVKRVHPRAPWTWLPSGYWPFPMTALKPTSDPLTPPWPDILISSGRRSVPYSLAIGRLSGEEVFRVHIQNPQCALDRFQFVIAPEHDGLRANNVLSTLGALNRLTPDLIARRGLDNANRYIALPRPLVGVLFGGASKGQRLSDNLVRRFAQQLENLRTQGYGIALTPSRRSDPAQIKLLQNTLGVDGVDIWNFEEDNPYFALLDQADYLIVTSDSVSMTSEAVTTGKPVYVVEAPGARSKFQRFHRDLHQRGMTRPFTGLLESFEYQALNETARIAEPIWTGFQDWQKRKIPAN